MGDAFGVEEPSLHHECSRRIVGDKRPSLPIERLSREFERFTGRPSPERSPLDHDRLRREHGRFLQRGTGLRRRRRRRPGKARRRRPFAGRLGPHAFQRNPPRRRRLRLLVDAQILNGDGQARHRAARGVARARGHGYGREGGGARRGDCDSRASERRGARRRPPRAPPPSPPRTSLEASFCSRRLAR